MESGVVDCFLKVLIALREHGESHGTPHQPFYPIEQEKISGVPEVLYDYFGTDVNLEEWNYVINLQNENARLGKGEVVLLFCF